MERKRLIGFGKPQSYGDNLAYLMGAEGIDWIPLTKNWLDTVEEVKNRNRQSSIVSIPFVSEYNKDLVDQYQSRFKEDLMNPYAEVLWHLIDLVPWNQYHNDEKLPQVAIVYGNNNKKIDQILERKGYDQVDIWFTGNPLATLSDLEKRGYNVKFYTFPSKVSELLPSALGRPVIKFSPEELEFLNRGKKSVILSDYQKLDPETIQQEEKKLETSIVGIYYPSDIEIVFPEERKNFDLIISSPSLLSFAQSLGFRQVYFHNFGSGLEAKTGRSPSSQEGKQEMLQEVLQEVPKGLKTIFVGPKKEYKKYLEVVEDFKYRDLGIVHLRELDEKLDILQPSLIIISDRLLSSFPIVKYERLGVNIYPLSAFNKQEIGTCSGYSGKILDLGKDSDHTCDSFLEDRKNTYPKLKPIVDHPINAEKAEKWINAHPLELQEMAHDFLKATRYVDFKTFYAQLSNSVDEFVREIKGRPFIILVRSEGETREKSNYWVAQLVWELLMKYDRLPVEVTDSLEYSVDKYPEVRDFMIPDDAAYSGTQLHFILQRELTETLEVFIEQQNEIDFDEIKYLKGSHEIPLCDRNKIPFFWTFHLVVPYMSEEALKVIPIDCRFNCYLNLRTYQQVVMERLSQIIGREKVEEMIKAKFIEKDKWPYYFDHKIADYASSYPKKYLRGEITGTDENIRFISNCLEPKDGDCYEAYYKSIWD